MLETWIGQNQPIYIQSQQEYQLKNNYYGYMADFCSFTQYRSLCVYQHCKVYHTFWLKWGTILDKNLLLFIYKVNK